MENNSVQNQPAMNTPVPQPQAQGSQPQATAPSKQPKEGRGLVVPLVVFLVIVLAAFGGFLVYKNMATGKTKNAQSSVSQTLQDFSALSQELNSVDAGSVDAELLEIDQDIQTL